jgi:MinD superfamily P-loop ATPase
MEIVNKNIESVSQAIQLLVISGKGGTGKTTLTAALTHLSRHAVVADCDVDAADLHLLIKPELYQSYEYFGGQKAVIDRDKCTKCDLCSDYCRFNAIDHFRINHLACEGCGFCYRICPDNAIEMHANISGYYNLARCKTGDFIFARLKPGEGNSGKLVSKVKNHAQKISDRKSIRWLFIDGPPGIGCPVNASLSGANIVLVITEPTVSGLHDLKRVIKLIMRFNIPAAVVINKYDLNRNMTDWIEKFAKKIHLLFVARIPFDDAVENALMAGKTVMEYAQSPAAMAISGIWHKINKLMN